MVVSMIVKYIFYQDSSIKSFNKVRIDVDINLINEPTLQ